MLILISLAVAAHPTVVERRPVTATVRIVAGRARASKADWERTPQFRRKEIVEDDRVRKTRVLVIEFE